MREAGTASPSATPSPRTGASARFDASASSAYTWSRVGRSSPVRRGPVDADTRGYLPVDRRGGSPGGPDPPSAVLIGTRNHGSCRRRRPKARDARRPATSRWTSSANVSTRPSTVCTMPVSGETPVSVPVFARTHPAPDVLRIEPVGQRARCRWRSAASSRNPQLQVVKFRRSPTSGRRGRARAPGWRHDSPDASCRVTPVVSKPLSVNVFTIAAAPASNARPARRQ